MQHYGACAVRLGFTFKRNFFFFEHWPKDKHNFLGILGLLTVAEAPPPTPTVTFCHLVSCLLVSACSKFWSNAQVWTFSLPLLHFPFLADPKIYSLPGPSFSQSLLKFSLKFLLTLLPDVFLTMQFLSISYMCDVSILSPPLPTTPSKVQDLFLISVGVDVHVCSLLGPFSVVCMYICSRMFLNYFIDEAIRTNNGDFHFLCNRVTAPSDRSLSGSRNKEVKYKGAHLLTHHPPQAHWLWPGGQA